MTARHCPGCRGYTRGWESECPGVTAGTGEFTVPDVVPPMRFADRIRALFGLPVFLGVAAGPLGDPELPLGDEIPG